MSQSRRTEVLEAFKDGHWEVLVTTDLAARGIDIPGLQVVVNYDLPRSADDYVHRIGRTGRAGASGLAVSFTSAATEAHFRLIEKRIKLPLPREQVAGFEPVEVAQPTARRRGRDRRCQGQEAEQEGQVAGGCRRGGAAWNEGLEALARQIWPIADSRRETESYRCFLPPPGRSG